MPDIEVELSGVTFCWNASKAQENRLKHQGVTFERATEVFFDPFLRVVDASRHGEARDKVIGYDAGTRLLTVVHIEWNDSRIRILSAWPASPEERRIYDS